MEFKLAVATYPPVIPADVLTRLSVRPLVVDTREREETYPIEPRPTTVDTSFGVDKKPAVLNPLCNPIVVDRIEDVKEAEEI